MINSQFDQKKFGNATYQPAFFAFFPKLSRGHNNKGRLGCVSENCGQKTNPHTGTNFTVWCEERGIKKPKG